MKCNLRHRTIYRDPTPGRIAVRLPLIDSLSEIHQDGSFALVEDPKQTKKTSIIGMFVLRPDRDAWKSHINEHASMRDVKNWTYNVKGAEGGWLIAGKNIMDSYRLALQYALADAVLVGSTTVSAEGITTKDKQGYVWHPYNPANWPHLVEADPEIFEKVMAQRREFQRLGYLSDRVYPAQIVITQSGDARDPAKDILAARVFHENDKDGNPIEAYILTSEDGAEKIRRRAGKFCLESRIGQILIPLSPKGNSGVIDLPRLPAVLYDKGIIIANHDGGKTVLSEFSKAGILPQMNLTLGRKYSVMDIIEKTDKLSKEEKDRIIEKFDNNTDKFFNTSDGKIPKDLIPAEVIVDHPNEAAVVVFDSRKLRGF